jgi:outer membrane protein assembly factor BamB
MYSSIRSSPAIGDDSTVYVGTEGGVLYAMNPDGLPVWSTPTSSGKFDISSPAIGSDGSIYIGSISSDLSLYAFSSAGALRWTYVTLGQIYSSPAISPLGYVVVTCSNYVYSLTPSGSLYWLYTMTGSSTTTSPVVDASGVVYATSNHLYAIYPTGSLKYITLVNAGPQTPVIAPNGLLYTGSGSTIYRVGTVVATQAPASPLSNPLAVDSASPKFKGDSKNTVTIE